MNDVAKVELGQIDRNKLGQVLGQAAHFQLGHVVMDHHRGTLAGRRAFLIQEVQRYPSTQNLVLGHAQEIQMQDQRLERMALHVTQQYALALAVAVELDQNRKTAV